jgi:hypothetical protein
MDEAAYVSEVLQHVPDKLLSFITLFLFEDKGLTDYSASILPFTTLPAVTFNNIFNFQSKLEQTLVKQIESGVSFLDRNIGLLTADPVLDTAELMASTVTGVFSKAGAQVEFSIFTDRHSWGEIVSQRVGTVES